MKDEIRFLAYPKSHLGKWFLIKQGGLQQIYLKIKSFYLSIGWQKRLIFLLLGISLIALTWAAYFYIPISVDWDKGYKPPTNLLLQGRSPYELDYILVPPWTFLPLIPFALLPPGLDRAVLFTVSVLTFACVAYYLGAKPLIILVIILSYPVFFSLVYGNLEWLISLGFILPSQIGLFFVLIKPQLGIPIALFWLVEAWRLGRIKEIVRVFWPVTMAFLIAFMIFGFWPAKTLKLDVIAAEYNSSLWPQSIPIGLGLLIAAIRTRKKSLAMISTPFLSPYVGPQSWSISILGLAALPLDVTFVSIGTWIVRLLSDQFLNS